MGFIITCVIFFIICGITSFLTFVKYQLYSIFYNDYVNLFLFLLFFCMALISFGGIIAGIKQLL